MRLLNVITLKVEEFLNDEDCSNYAILSHTWGKGEVSFQDISTRAARSMAGYRKIKNCCKQAREDGFIYVWIDTCCIDKTSSAELSEAINSMYKWYEHARVCYVYLSDVPTGDNHGDRASYFSKCRWFTRCWTLQELLAPSSVVFYNNDWIEIGTKYSLREEISYITTIPCEVLLSKPLDEICIAQRMSWAARRETTRAEDTAYSLMGLFNVNMPILYGEGWKAFIRVQQEIMKDSDDHSLFAWVTPPYMQSMTWFKDRVDGGRLMKSPAEFQMKPMAGLLASQLRHFQHSKAVRRLDVPGQIYAFSMTNKGLSIKLPLVRVPGETDIFQAILNCEVMDQTGPLVIYLKEVNPGQYCRIALNHAHPTYTRDTTHTGPVDIYVKAIYVAPNPKAFWSPIRHTIHLSINSPNKRQFAVLEGFYDDMFIEFDPPINHCRPSYVFSQDCKVAAVLRFGIDGDPTSQLIIILAREFVEIRCAIMALPSVTLTKLLGDLDSLKNLESNFNSADRLTRQLTPAAAISISSRPGSLVTEIPGQRQSHNYLTIAVTSTPKRLIPVPVAPRLHRVVFGFDRVASILPFFAPKGNWHPCGPDENGKMEWFPSPEEASALVMFPQIGINSSILKHSLFLVFHASPTGVSYEFFLGKAAESLWSEVQSLYSHNYNSPVMVGKEVFESPMSAVGRIACYTLKVQAGPPALDGIRHRIVLSLQADDEDGLCIQEQPPSFLTM